MLNIDELRVREQIYALRRLRKDVSSLSARFGLSPPGISQNLQRTVLGFYRFVCELELGGIALLEEPDLLLALSTFALRRRTFLAGCAGEAVEKAYLVVCKDD